MKEAQTTVRNHEHIPARGWEGENWGQPVVRGKWTRTTLPVAIRRGQIWAATGADVAPAPGDPSLQPCWQGGMGKARGDPPQGWALSFHLSTAGRAEGSAAVCTRTWERSGRQHLWKKQIRSGTPAVALGGSPAARAARSQAPPGGLVRRRR